MKVVHTTLIALAALGAGLTAQAPGPAHAAGFYIPERGARALAMGGAQIAGADDMNAQWLNPAGLTRLRGDLELYLDLGLILTNQSFARADDAEVMRKDPRYADGFPTVDNEGPPFFDPSLGVASRFGLEDWIFALGVYGPYAGTNAWPQEGPQRYSLVSLDALEFFVQASVGWKINDYVAVGVGLQWVVTDVVQRLQISAYPGVFGWAEQQDMDTLAEVRVVDAFSPSGNLGVIITPVDFFEIGLSGQLPVSAEASGTLTARVPAHYYFSDVTIQGDKINVALDFPAMLRAGIRFFEGERWSVELATVVEFWSTLDTIDVSPGEGGIAFENVPGIGTYRVKPFSIATGHKDTVSVRLGGSWRPDELPVTFRAGAFYEQASVPDQTVSVLKIDNEKFGAALGATIHADPVAIDVTAGYVHQLPRTVTASEKTQVNPLYDEDAQPYGESGPHVVGNGTYDGNYLIFATTLHASF